MEDDSPDNIDKELTAQVWYDYLTTGATPKGMKIPWFERPAIKPIFRRLPADPRCKICYIPFAGFGGFISRHLLNVKPSRMNPHVCDVCERFAERYPGGTELEVSILFADIRGSTPLAERMQNREFTELIQRFYEAGIRALYANSAFIEKFAGDGLSAFFTPSLAGSNHALTAIKAAKEILRVTGHGKGKTPWIPVGIGVNTGVAYVGSINAERGRTDITMLGDVVNTTARLGSLSEAGEVLVGQRAMEMSGLSMEDHGSRSVSLKGKEEPVTAWSVAL